MAVRLRGCPDTTKQARLKLGAALPDGAWLALHHDQTLLDRRLWISGSARGVEFEVDSVTRVQVLLCGGESARTEFKQRSRPLTRAGS